MKFVSTTTDKRVNIGITENKAYTGQLIYIPPMVGSFDGFTNYGTIPGPHICFFNDREEWVVAVASHFVPADIP